MYHPVAFLLGWALQITDWLLLAWIILSWIDFFQQSQRKAPIISMGNPVRRVLDDFANAVLRPVRRIISPYQRGVGIDFSAIIVFILIGILQAWVATLPF